MRAAVVANRAERHFSWRESGRSDGTLALLLLHGLLGSRLSWEPQLGELSLSRRVAAWDAPGYGGSAPLDAPTSFAALADAVVRWADALGAPRFHLAGLSFGGMIAQHAAVRHGDRIASLTLLASSPKFGLDGTQPDVWRAQRLSALEAGQQPVDFAPRVLRAISGPNLRPEAFAEQVASAERVSADALRAAIDVLPLHDTLHQLANLDMPTAVMVGALDAQTPVSYAECLAENIPGAVLHVVSGAGHLLNAEAPNDVNQILAAHIAAAEASQAKGGVR
jgi:pimeloyl-ACP methyl ester carboxylesterase